MDHAEIYMEDELIWTNIFMPSMRLKKSAYPTPGAIRLDLKSIHTCGRYQKRILKKQKNR